MMKQLMQVALIIGLFLGTACNFASQVSEKVAAQPHEQHIDRMATATPCAGPVITEYEDHMQIMVQNCSGWSGDFTLDQKVIEFWNSSDRIAVLRYGDDPKEIAVLNSGQRVQLTVVGIYHWSKE